MKQYLESLKLIVEHGHNHPDRTGSGRRSVFGTQERYDLSEGFPLVTTRKIYTKSLILELLWFIRGETNIKTLGCSFWDKWAVEESHVTKYMETEYKEMVDRFIKRRSLTDNSEIEKELFEEHKKHSAAKATEKHIGSIGPMYGYVWRNAPTREKATEEEGALNFLLRPHRTFEQIPSDKLDLYKKVCKEHEKLLHREIGEEELLSICNVLYWRSYDQLNEVLISLKERPYSARHCITAWIPEYLPDETASPQTNVLHGYGALAPCHAFFQFFVTPGKTEEDKKQISLQIYLRSNDCPVGKPYNIAQYALLLSMVAHVSDMVAKDVVFTSGDSHIYLNQLDQVETQLNREPLPLPKLWLNPEVKDLFKFTMDDIRIEGYQHHDPIVYPTSV